MIFKRTHLRNDGTKSILYYAVVSIPSPGSGKRTRDWGHGYRTREEAVTALDERRAKLTVRSAASPSGLQLGPYLVEQWLPSIVDRVEPTTHVAYARAVARVVPRLGGMKLRDVTTLDLSNLYRELRDRGSRYQDPARADETRPLSTSSVRGVHAVMSKALNDAVDLGLLIHNPVHRAKPPRVRLDSDGKAWTSTELATFLRSVEDDPLYPVWRLTACTGMRRGEVMGLRWCDIDLVASSLAIRQARTLVRRTVITTTPKSGHPRVVNLDDETVASLAKFRDAGSDSQDLIVRAPDGRPMHPDRLSQLFRKLGGWC